VIEEVDNGESLDIHQTRRCVDLLITPEERGVVGVQV
jgi:hypothetical protein